MKLFAFYILLSFLFSVSSCSKSKEMQSVNEGLVVKYFSGWIGYAIPMQPKGEISKEEADALDAYYVGTFEKDLLVSFEKFLHQERVWIDHYTYWENSKKLRKRKMIKSSGEEQIQLFDEKGKYLKEE